MAKDGEHDLMGARNQHYRRAGVNIRALAKQYVSGGDLPNLRHDPPELGLLARGAALLFLPTARRRPSFGHLAFVAEEEMFHLLQKKILRIRIAQAEAIMVDEQRLVGWPHLPRFARNLVEDALAQLALERRFVQAGQQATKLAAHHHACVVGAEPYVGGRIGHVKPPD